MAEENLKHMFGRFWKKILGESNHSRNFYFPKQWSLWQKWGIKNSNEKKKWFKSKNSRAKHLLTICVFHKRKFWLHVRSFGREISGGSWNCREFSTSQKKRFSSQTNRRKHLEKFRCTTMSPDLSAIPLVADYPAWECVTKTLMHQVTD